MALSVRELFTLTSPKVKNSQILKIHFNFKFKIICSIFKNCKIKKIVSTFNAYKVITLQQIEFGTNNNFFCKVL